ncbi:MAG: hypothetical protein MJ252_25435 [archaeon]|nr:hypothetical protein [archaeon]
MVNTPPFQEVKKMFFDMNKNDFLENLGKSQIFKAKEEDNNSSTISKEI